MLEINDPKIGLVKFPCKLCGRHIQESDPCAEVSFWISGWEGEDEKRKHDFICVECYNKVVEKKRQDIKIRNFGE